MTGIWQEMQSMLTQWSLSPDVKQKRYSSSRWRTKQVAVEEAISKIPHGSTLFTSNGHAYPQQLMEGLVKPDAGLVDIRIVQVINAMPVSYLKEFHNRFRVNTFFVDPFTRKYVNTGYGDYTPLTASDLSRLICEEKLRIDIAFIKVTPPDKNGMCSLGVAVDFAKDVVNHARLVIAEVSEAMPWTYGDSLISANQIDHWVVSEKPLLEFKCPFGNEIDDVMQQIGQHIAAEIEDGSTLRMGPHFIDHVVANFLADKKRLKLHAELFSMVAQRLMEVGAMDRAVVAHCLGDRELYDFVDRNPRVRVYPMSHIVNIENIRKHRRMVTIASAREIDLTGQACTDSKGHEFTGGFSGTWEFVQGSHLSEEGKSFIALPSLRNKGKESNIVASLSPGAGVTVNRANIHYVATEYGVAELYGRPIRERCLGLIEITHPRFRDTLLRQAKALHYVNPQQPGSSFRSRYPAEWETQWTLKSGKSVFVRPVKAIDEDSVRAFFHSLSDRSIYMRYFRPMRSLPQQLLQGSVDIDYSQNMTLVVLDTSQKRQEIIAMGQWVLDSQDGIPELAFQVSDAWQGQGLGKYLLQRLIQIAQVYQFEEMKAEVLADNLAMLAVLEESGYPTRYHNEFEIVTLHLAISSQEA